MASTVSSPGVRSRPLVINARRTDSIDAPHIIQLSSTILPFWFTRVNVVDVIEKAVLAVTLCNENEEIIGHASFYDYPNVEGVDMTNWVEWMSVYYDTSKITPLNTLFVHYLVARRECNLECVKEIVRTVFNAEPNVHYLFLTVPPGCTPDMATADVFKIIETADEMNDLPSVYVCGRHEHVPVLHIRRARVTDNDELFPIFERQSTMLSETYGDYFLAELVEAQNDKMACLVAEVEGLAQGFISLSEDVNYELLNECFELGPFHGLRKPHPEDNTSQMYPMANEAAETENSETDSESEVNETKETEEPSANSVDNMSEKPPDMDVFYQVKLIDVQLGTTISSASSPPEPESVAGLCRKMFSPRSQHTSCERFVPTYKGEPNAFSVQLFCIDERYEMRSIDFLAKAFKIFPDRDFCIISVPHMVPVFPLLQQFVRITPRCPSTLNQELYVFHRSGLLQSFIVRQAEIRDLDNITNLVSTLHNHAKLLRDLHQYYKARRDDDDTELQAFVATCNQQIVGVAIIRREEDIEYIRSHYNIEDFIYFNHHRREDHGHLYHFALNPIFNHLTKHFLKEILRLGHKTCLYYPLYPPTCPADILEKYTLVTCLTEMVPVRARRQIVYPKESLGINAPTDRVFRKQPQYALNHINRKLTLEPKVTVNARIVVVGASLTGITFLEALAYCPHMRFNNLTLVSPHGLPGDIPPDILQAIEPYLSGSDDFENSAKSTLQTWVNVVLGKMTAIDRKRKNVIVNGTDLVPYDYLILCTGRQYQVPAPTDANIALPDITNEYVPNSPDRPYLGTPPENIYLVNDIYDAAVALYKVEATLANTDKQIIIYGNTLDAFCCVQFLLTLGINGKNISLVQPPLINGVTCFNNPDIETLIYDTLKTKEVAVYSGYYLAQWNDGEQNVSVITSASFTSDKEPLRLECDAFFSYYYPSVDFQAFKAIDDACLNYDGKLVIDASFHTNDAAIRGAGSLTKFKRIYYADQWSHLNFNSKEIGMALAGEMLRLFDPTLPLQPEPNEDPYPLIPSYQSPKIIQAVTPGGYHYLHIHKPDLPVPKQSRAFHCDSEKELVTGKPGGELDYFLLYINQYSTVETITCLAKQPIPVSNYLSLYGLHERFLNSLVSRFEENLIKDFYSFFRESWVMGVFHDRFADFRDEIRELLVSRAAADLNSMEEKVREVIDEEVPLTSDQRKQLLHYFAFSGTKRAVETRLLNFISYNYYHIPMYAKPGMV